MSLTDASPETVAQAAAISAQGLSTLSEQDRNEALVAIHSELAKHKTIVLRANAIDIAAAKKAASQVQLSDSLLKRLDLTAKYDDMLQGILDVRDLEDPGECKSFPLATMLLTYIRIGDLWDVLHHRIILMIRKENEQGKLCTNSVVQAVPGS